MKMMNRSTLNIVLIGGGRIADVHAPGYLASKRGRLYGLCDLNPDVLAKRKQEWKLVKTYTRFEDVLADEDVDMVEILTPHHLHHPMVLAAARAGKHVSVQKPMALNLAQCDEMIRVCKESGVKLRVFENFVFYPPYIRAKELLREGAVGTPMSIRMRLGAGYGGWEIPLRAWTWRLNEAASGGGPTVFDDGFHKFSVAIDFFGSVDEVTGWIGETLSIIDSPAAISWKHSSGVLGFLDAALTPNLFIDGKYYPADERVEITGTEGLMVITMCTGSPLEAPPLLIWKGGECRTISDIPTDWLTSFSNGVDQFINALWEGREPCLTGERGREVTAFALGALEAARSSRTICLRDEFKESV